MELPVLQILVHWAESEFEFRVSYPPNCEMLFLLKVELQRSGVVPCVPVSLSVVKRPLPSGFPKMKVGSEHCNCTS